MSVPVQRPNPANSTTHSIYVQDVESDLSSEISVCAVSNGVILWITLQIRMTASTPSNAEPPKGRVFQAE